jgi:hypothetical protein
MPMVIVPDSLRHAINAKLDASIAACPDAEKDRETLYGQLLDYFYENGVVPDFTLAKKKG